MNSWSVLFSYTSYIPFCSYDPLNEILSARYVKIILELET